MVSDFPFSLDGKRNISDVRVSAPDSFLEDDPQCPSIYVGDWRVVKLVPSTKSDSDVWLQRRL